MLTLTRKTDYAVVALSHLALSGGAWSSAREIAERYHIPSTLLMNVLKALARGGMVESTRGSRGGYRLKCAPETISLLAVIDVIEGGVHLFQCDSEGARDATSGCDIETWCPMSGTARHVNDRFRAFLGSITLAEIAAAPHAGMTPLRMRISAPVMAEID